MNASLVLNCSCSIWHTYRYRMTLEKRDICISFPPVGVKDVNLTRAAACQTGNYSSAMFLGQINTSHPNMSPRHLITDAVLVLAMTIALPTSLLSSYTHPTIVLIHLDNYLRKYSTSNTC